MTRTSGTLDGDIAGLDVDFDAFRNRKRLLGVYVLHRGRVWWDLQLVVVVEISDGFWVCV